MTATPLYVYGRPVALIVGVLAWPLAFTGTAGEGRPGWLTPEHGLRFVRPDKPGACVVKSEDGRLWVVALSLLTTVEGAA